MSHVAGTAGASRYLDLLPAVYREGADGSAGFLGSFLLAFEHLLTGVGDEKRPGFDEILDRVHRYFDPLQAPSEFLDWLAGWVALTLRGDLDAVRLEGEDTGATRDTDRRRVARDFIANAVRLYRLRGTRRGLEEMIRLYTGLSPTITELTAALQIGVTSRIGVDTVFDGGAPHFFHVLLRLSQPDPEARRRTRDIARAIIEMEKPAHTRYQLDVLTPEMQISVHSRIGVDTLLAPARRSPT